ncbi:unnamed protein product [Clonostachys rhizophaga]|uniref:Uncharacterized protein n=1 Tax=Clonostachys rhizophaga TaxID=160324 RepID=A0A9N9YDV9_9HYPO|nr:unnamed protein product [Clonostachys rhizophaga]
MASRPMSSKRMIRSPEYSVRVGHIQAQTPAWPLSDRNQSNDGLLFFILPAMANLPFPVRRLAWQDELQGNGAFGALWPDAFTHLDTLSISLSKAFFFPLPTTDTLAGLTDCLEACTNVRHLSLGIESDCGPRPEVKFYNITTRLLRFSPETKRSNWNRLVSLNLTSMILEDHILFSVVRENAETLLYLYLQECNITLGRLKELSKIPGLHLQSAQILSEHPQHQCHRIPQQKLLGFLKHQRIPEGEVVQMCIYRDGTLEIDAPGIPQSPYCYETSPHRMFDDDCPEFFTNTLVMTLPVDLLGGTSFDDDEFEPERLNNADIDASDQSVAERIRNGPKWLLNRCCDNNIAGKIYFTQVPNSHPGGFPTVVWRFTDRNGVSYFGNDPWEGFEDWDPNQGDVEEPLPYSAEMDEAIQAASLGARQGVILYNRNDAFQAKEFIHNDFDC